MVDFQKTQVDALKMGEQDFENKWILFTADSSRSPGGIKKIKDVSIRFSVAVNNGGEPA